MNNNNTIHSVLKVVDCPSLRGENRGHQWANARASKGYSHHSLLSQVKVRELFS